MLSLEPAPERLTLDIGHREPEKAGGLSRIVNREDVRMLQPGSHLDLAKEPLGTQSRGQFRMKHFQGDESIVLDVPGEIHRRHAATAELTLDVVAVQ